MAKKPGARKKKQKTAAEMGSRPVQETDTGLGGMTSGGPTRRGRKATAASSRTRGGKTTASENANKADLKKAITAHYDNTREFQAGMAFEDSLAKSRKEKQNRKKLKK